MWKYILAAVVIALGIGNLSQNSAMAETTGWINAHELRKLNGTVFSRLKQLPYAIQCKAIEGIQTRDNILLKISYRPNSKKTKWRWAWGSSFKVYKKGWAVEGYRQVSYDRFTRN